MLLATGMSLGTGVVQSVAFDGRNAEQENRENTIAGSKHGTDKIFFII